MKNNDFSPTFSFFKFQIRLLTEKVADQPETSGAGERERVVEWERDEGGWDRTWEPFEPQPLCLTFSTLGGEWWLPPPPMYAAHATGAPRAAFPSLSSQTGDARQVNSVGAAGA
mgnify:CR=1 FL=1